MKTEPNASVGEGASWDTGRRALLIAGVAALVGASAKPAAAQSTGSSTPTPAQLGWVSSEHRLVRRVTMGITEPEWRRAKSLGFYGYLERQMNAATLDDAESEAMARQLFPRVGMTAHEIATSGAEWEIGQEFLDYTLFMGAFSKRQLLQRMIEFWTDHFNVSTEKVGVAFRTVMIRDVIRRHALGRFPDLLRGVMRSAAMLAYLDNDQNYGDSPNQNLARELMELHSIGVDGGYTQTDVEEVAKCLSGWVFEWDGNLPTFGHFVFDAGRHAPGPKTVLGQVINETGEQEFERVLTILYNHPNCARFMCRKLIHFMLGSPAPAGVQQAAETAWMNTRGNIQVVLRAILTRANLLAAPAKFKRPQHFIISAMRSIGHTRRSLGDLKWTLGEMGHMPGDWPAPDGYPDVPAYWSSLLLPRHNVAMMLAHDWVTGLQLPVERFNTPPAWRNVYDKIQRELFGGEIMERDRIVLRDFLAAHNDNTGVDTVGLRAAMAYAMSSPAFQWF